jgi:excisionase family DNA binding protein
VTAVRPPRLQASGSKSSGSAPQLGPAVGEGFDPQDLLTPDEVCALLKLKWTWFYAEVARGALRPRKLGRRTRVRRRDLEAILAGRPGSWEADGVRKLLTGTVGCDEQQLHEHRTEPVVNIDVDIIMFALEVWQAYDEAGTALQRGYDDLGAASWTGCSGDAPQDLSPVTLEEQQQDEITSLEHQLEQQRQSDWAAYSTALQTYIEAQGAQIDGLRVPVLVTTDSEAVPVNSASGMWGSDLGEPLADRLLNAAIDATPPPGKAKRALEGLTDHAG